MENFILSKKQLFFLFIIGLSLLILSFGYGYFFGKYHQIHSQKSVLQVVPELNCRKAASFFYLSLYKQKASLYSAGEFSIF